jgi:ABC-2 type transport system permease protein
MFLASRTKGYLIPIGFVVITIITVQMVGMNGQYIPWSIPPLFAASQAPDSDVVVSWVHYTIMSFASLAGLVATLAQWRFADQK